MAGDEPTQAMPDLEKWREERQKEEERRLVIWLERCQTALAVVVPLLGLLWAWALLQREDVRTRLQGACLGAWALLGCVLWIVIWALWGSAIAKVLWGPVAPGVLAGALRSMLRP